MVFIKSAVKPDIDPEQSYYFYFSDADILLKTGGEEQTFPLLGREKASAFGFEERRFIGLLDAIPCYVVTKAGKLEADGCDLVRLRDFYLNGARELSGVAGYARQIYDFNVNARFCGRCAAPMAALTKEHGRQCVKCKVVIYPRISPAVIVAVIKDDRILLARGRSYSDKKMFSVLAGFVEPGESLEDTVKREILEEVGIEVTNVRYFKSQSWPFPDSLMIGFTADHLRGDIKIDDHEIVEAAWFKTDALPIVPAKRSISSELIQWFVEKRVQQ
ncbi:MAG: NAD(+) diphosphatase [Candidatus Omnitrophica bacterium]|nr:NAD(+) diphosphatase [Candidatus Omnitrophota bacterium]